MHRRPRDPRSADDFDRHGPHAPAVSPARGAKPPASVRQSSAPALFTQKPSTPPRRAHSLGSPSPATTTMDVYALLATTARTLQRAASGYFGLTRRPVPTTWCQICFENVPTVDTTQLVACGHRFCVPCLKRYLELKIKEGNVFPVCFHPVEQTACGTRVDDAQLQDIVDRDVWAKCTLFRFNKAHTTARECPFCQHPQQCAGPEQPECVCETCGRVFCFFHGNAHAPPSTCADYERKHAESETQSRATIARVTKPCPGCKANVEKAGGCNHMTCVVCRSEFCWICNEKLEPGHVSDHFRVTNLRCGGRQFDAVDIDGRESLWARFCRVYSALHLKFAGVLYLIAYYVVYPLAVALALLTVGVTRVRPIPALASTTYSSLLETFRMAAAALAAFVAFIYTFKLLPTSVSTAYVYTHQVKTAGELAVLIWPHVVTRSRVAWTWVRVRAGVLRGRHVEDRQDASRTEQPEREPLFA